MMSTESVSADDNINKTISQWGCKYLLSLGYLLKSNLPENVLNTPWSYVVRFETSDGYIYLKHMPEQIALEATVIQVLHDQFHACVPEVIAHNTELNCFLMKDAGRSLREILKQKFDTVLLCKGIDQFTSMQLAVADHLNIFFDMGVPDWRLDKLPDLYKQVLAQKDLLIVDGLSEIEIGALEALIPTVSHLCQQLSSYGIKQSIVQPDFHDNNMLIADRSQDITIIDLGEVAISHPFFSLLGCLNQAKRHHGLTDKDDVYLQLRDACLKNYMQFASEKHLLEAFELVRILGSVYGILSGYRLMMACGKERLMSFQPGKFSQSFKELIIACRSIDGF